MSTRTLPPGWGCRYRKRGDTRSSPSCNLQCGVCIRMERPYCRCHIGPSTCSPRAGAGNPTCPRDTLPAGWGRSYRKRRGTRSSPSCTIQRRPRMSLDPPSCARHTNGPCTRPPGPEAATRAARLARSATARRRPCSGTPTASWGLGWERDDTGRWLERRRPDGESCTWCTHQSLHSSTRSPPLPT